MNPVRTVLLLALGVLAAVAALSAGGWLTGESNEGVRAQAVGGPVVLMGIDAEDGGPGGHGPIGVYEDVVTSLLTNVGNGGSGVLVIGGGKGADDVTTWWDTIATDLSITVTYVNGDTNIASQSFSGFAMIAVVSSASETSSGGLTQAENDALAGRLADVLAHVNGGGALFGLSQAGLTNPYEYIAGIGTVTFEVGLSYGLIAPTAEGTAIGITDALDLCCWHDVYLTFPDFLDVLATQDDSFESNFGEAAAIGGIQVVLQLEGPPGDPTCSDDIDNDADTLVDEEDPDCVAEATPTPTPEPEPTATATPDEASDVTELPDTGGSPGGGSGPLPWLAGAAAGLALTAAGGWWLARRGARTG
jgi:hypothetical protein